MNPKTKLLEYGIVTEPYKLPEFERRLKAANLSYKNVGLLNPKAVVLIVEANAERVSEVKAICEAVMRWSKTINRN